MLSTLRTSTGLQNFGVTVALVVTSRQLLARSLNLKNQTLKSNTTHRKSRTLRHCRFPPHNMDINRPPWAVFHKSKAACNKYMALCWRRPSPHSQNRRTSPASEGAQFRLDLAKLTHLSFLAQDVCGILHSTGHFRRHTGHQGPKLHCPREEKCPPHQGPPRLPRPPSQNLRLGHPSCTTRSS